MSVRSYFFDEADAHSVVIQLRAGGFEATLERGSFAGEDDDEDQPWVLLTDAPDVLVEVAVEEAGGWVEYDPAAESPPEPLPLPTEPQRRPGD